MIHYHTSSNVPGYMPEEDGPSFAYATFQAAKESLIAELVSDADSYGANDDDDTADSCSAAAEDVNLWNGPDVAYVGSDRPHDLGRAYQILECHELECLEEEDNSDVDWPEPGDDTSEGWACSDCCNLIANAELPAEMGEQAAAAYLKLVEAGQAGTVAPYVTLGRLAGLHGCGRPHAWDDEEHSLECERIDFSWSRCDICRRPSQAGERHAVTFHLEPTDAASAAADR